MIDTSGTNDPLNLAALAIADLVIVPFGSNEGQVRAIELTLLTDKEVLIVLELVLGKFERG